MQQIDPTGALAASQAYQHMAAAAPVAAPAYAPQPAYHQPYPAYVRDALMRFLRQFC